MSLIEIIQITLLLIASWVAWQLYQGAPFLPTHQRHIAEVLKLLDLKPGQLLYDLGSGDGRILSAAAEKGLMAVGFEINPLLVIISRWRLRRWGRNITVVWGNALKVADLSQADGVYVFQSKLLMRKLQRKTIGRMKKGSRIVTYGYEFPDFQASKKVGALFVYESDDICIPVD